MSDLNAWKHEQRRLALEQKRQKLEELKERSRKALEVGSSSSSVSTSTSLSGSQIISGETTKFDVSKILENISSTSDIDDLVSRLSQVTYSPTAKATSTINTQTGVSTPPSPPPSSQATNSTNVPISPLPELNQRAQLTSPSTETEQSKSYLDLSKKASI
jgi:hypothetical protein